MKNTGFTLIETIVTIVVLALALSGAVFLMSQLIHTNANNKHRVQATYLAQECTELLRNFRDNTWKQHNNWLCAFDDFGAEYSIADQTVGSWPDTRCQGKFAVDIMKNPADFQLYSNTSSGILSHDTAGEATPFFRKIFVAKQSDGQTPDINQDIDGNVVEARFTCEVFWGGDPMASPYVPKHSVKVSTWLTNWLKI